jgi:hypothetical protein
VLVDTILQHSDLSKFRESFEQHECAAAAAGLQENADSSEPGHSSSEGTAAAGPQQQLSPHADLLQQHTPVLQDACCDAAPYVTRLLHTIQHSTVQQVLSWQADDWHVFFSATAAELSLKLQMLASDAANSHHHHQQQHKQQHTAAAAAAAAAPHMDVVQQQFCQVGPPLCRWRQAPSIATSQLQGLQACSVVLCCMQRCSTSHLVTSSAPSVTGVCQSPYCARPADATFECQYHHIHTPVLAAGC